MKLELGTLEQKSTTRVPLIPFRNGGPSAYIHPATMVNSVNMGSARERAPKWPRSGGDHNASGKREHSKDWLFQQWDIKTR